MSWAPTFHFLMGVFIAAFVIEQYRFVSTAFYDRAMTDNVRFKDFTISADPIGFRIAPDNFPCYPEIPLDTLMEVAALSQQTDVSSLERFKQMMDVFVGIIEPHAYELFKRRCRPGTEKEPNPNPIGMRHIRDLLPWVMEVYGVRPTQESSDSADGSNDDDTSLTDGASPEASTS